MGRGKSGIGTGSATAAAAANVVAAPRIEQITPPPIRLYSKSQVDQLTESYTPEQFLGDTSQWTGTVNDARMLAEDNMPQTLEVGGYTFQQMGAPDVSFVDDGKLKNNVVVLMDYQSTEKVGNEYPVLQVGVRIRKYRGKVQTEIVRDNPLYGTRFW